MVIGTRKFFNCVIAASVIVTPSALGVASSSGIAGAADASCGIPGSGYGQMFPRLAGATWTDTSIRALSTSMMAEAETTPTPEGQADPEDNPDIPAGYTYFGQFVDHDLTLDDRPNDLTTPTPISALKNLRTPQLDLDSVYGTGPSGSPSLYESDGMHLKVGRALTGSPDVGAVDLPRNATTGQAIIGDPRNDENRIVAAIHTLFLRFHNQIVDRVRAETPRMSATEVFTRARQRVVFTYQTIVLQDFLPIIAGARVTRDVVWRTDRGWQTNLRFYNPCQQMPVEFSVAAYRYGHSMVRGLYRINANVDRLSVFSGTYQAGSDLSGFAPAPSNFALNWDLFVPGARNPSVRAQPSYKIDGSLTHALSLLPLPTTGTGPANLAMRNLLRSKQLGLPSGQSVARAMGVEPLPDSQILVGKATGDASEAQTLVSVSSEFANNAPLWTYILAEATAHAYPVRDGKIVGPQRAPYRLGPVGGRIVVETIVGLLRSDANSILNRNVATDESSLRALVNRVTTPRPAPEPSVRPNPVLRPPAPRR
ncbi:MAG: peroxidase family protein [Acidimicrobiia bacterium]